MSTPCHSGRVLSAVLLLALGLAACEGAFETPVEPEFAAASDPGGARAFEVYTQNLYLGGDTGPIFTLDFSNIPAVIQAANVFWNDVQNSRFPERAVEIVDEIAQRRPHVVGFQEVLQFVVLDGSFQPIGGLDLLAEIEEEIASRNLPYVTEVTQSNTSGTLPLAFDPAIPGISRWLHFTDRVVSLRRTDVELVDEAKGQYAARFAVGPLALTRGWNRMSVEHAGTTYQFINTHLEVQALAPVQAGQAAELQNVVAADLEGVTIIVGDLNSDATGMPGQPEWTPTYGNLVDAGFLDLWNVAPPANRDPVGLTCCHDKNLTGDVPFTSRIDFVLVRSSNPTHLSGNENGAYRVEIVGEEDSDRTQSGLWPSDHAGVVGSVRLPSGSH